MKRIFTLITMALVAASFSAFAQNNNEVLEQARQQVQEKQDALDDAERAHRQQQAESRRNINAAERQIDALTDTARAAFPVRSQVSALPPRHQGTSLSAR